MLNKKLMMLTIFLVSLLAVSAASAADNTANDVVSVEETTDDIVSVEENQVIEQTDNDNIISGKDEGTFTALQNKINNASDGSTIALENDYVFDESLDDNQGIYVEKNLIIDGKNHKVTGLRENNRFVISTLQDSTIVVTLKNINFINCGCNFESDWNDGIVNGNIENCNFYDRTYGGAVNFEGKTLTINNSNFINCNSTGSGGAVSISNGFCTISDCNFINNTVDGKYISQDSYAIGSYVQYQSRGGAIYSGDDAQLSVYNCKFLNNNAKCTYCGGNGNDGYGGAVHIKSDNSVVKNCYFEGNSASRSSDAIYWEGDNGNLVSCTFNNTASVYGANNIYWVGEHGIISNCKSTEGTDTLNIFENSTVVNRFDEIGVNHEKDDGKFSTLQKKIDDAKIGATVTLENDYFYDSGVDDTVGISISKSLTIDGQGHILDGLSESRIISVNGIYSITLKNIKFKNGFNGAINIDSSYQPANNHPYFKIINCEFDNNAAYNGGAIYCEISYGIIENCIFNSNVANNRGGAIMFAHSLTNKYWYVTDCTFYNNSASSGGAIYSEHERLTVETSKFNNNKASYRGGAIAIERSSTSSGGKYLGGHNSKIVGCEFNYNRAAYYGGAVYVYADYCSLDSSLFKYNVADFTGDAVYWDESSSYTHGSILNCTSFTIGSETDNIHIYSSYETPKTTVEVSIHVTPYPILTANDLTKTYGTSTKLVVYLKDSKGNAIANAKVNVKINNKITPITTGSNGQATMPISLAPATYTATISYTDKMTCADAKTNAKIVVKKATPKLTAKAKTFKKSVKTKKYTITLKNNLNKVMKNTKVTLTVKGKTYTAKTNSKGVATFKITKLTKKGKYTAVVKYAGSKYYNAKTVKPKITIK